MANGQNQSELKGSNEFALKVMAKSDEIFSSPTVTAQQGATIFSALSRYISDHDTTELVEEFEKVK
jgi:hypothetical protein